MRFRLEFVQGKSSKFWQVTQTGTEVEITFGRIGTAGQTQRRSFDDEATAHADAQKQMKGKLKKGYRPVAAPRLTASKESAAFPFLFIGQGFGTSYKNLECFAWFHKALTAAQQKVAANFSEEVLFPSTKTWKAFCAHFERAMLAVNEVSPLRLVLKPNDQGTEGGAWHRWALIEQRVP